MESLGGRRETARSCRSRRGPGKTAVPEQFFATVASPQGQTPSRLIDLLTVGDGGSTIATCRKLDSLIRDSLLQIEREPFTEVESQ